MLANQINRLPTIGGLSYHPQVHMFGEKLAQTRTDDCMVIHNANFNHEYLFFMKLRKLSRRFTGVDRHAHVSH